MELPVLRGLLAILGLATAVLPGGCLLGFTITAVHALTRRRP